MPPAPEPVTLVIGAEELLVSRAVARLLAGVTAAAGSPVQVREIAPGEFTDADVLDLESPSLFDEPRSVVVRGGAELAEAYREALVRYAADPLPDLFLVVVHPGGVKGKRLVDGLTAAGAAVVRCPAPTRLGERLDFVADEARAAGAQLTSGACRALLDAVGGDLRDLATAVAQLAADVGGRIDEAAVARFHRGRAETRGFDVADATLAGDVCGALALLGAALETGTAPVLVTSALASGLRDMTRVRAAGGNPAAIARGLGMPPWKVDRTLRIARGWSDDRVAAAIAVVAAGDADVKGAGADAGYALESTVLAVAGLAARR